MSVITNQPTNHSVSGSNQTKGRQGVYATGTSRERGRLRWQSYHSRLLRSTDKRTTFTHSTSTTARLVSHNSNTRQSIQYVPSLFYSIERWNHGNCSSLMECLARTEKKCFGSDAASCIVTSITHDLNTNTHTRPWVRCEHLYANMYQDHKDVSEGYFCR